MIYLVRSAPLPEVCALHLAVVAQGGDAAFARATEPGPCAARQTSYATLGMHAAGKKKAA